MSAHQGNVDPFHLEQEHFEQMSISKLYDLVSQHINVIRREIIELSNVNCGLRENEIGDHNRCLGRCIPTRDRCNLPRIDPKWCRFHSSICKSVAFIYHNLIDEYSEMIGLHIQKAEGMTWTIRGLSRHQNLFKNKKSMVRLNDKNLIDQWINFLDHVGYEDILDKIPNVITMIQVYIRFFIASGLRSMNFDTCYYNYDSATDKGHFISMIFAASIAEKIGHFLGTVNRYIVPDIIQGYDDLNVLLDKLTHLNGVMKVVNEEEYHINRLFILKSVPLDINPVRILIDRFPINESNTLSLISDIFEKWLTRFSRRYDNDYHKNKFESITHAVTIPHEVDLYYPDTIRRLYIFATSTERINSFLYFERERTYQTLQQLIAMIVLYGGSSVPKRYVKVKSTSKEERRFSPMKL